MSAAGSLATLPEDAFEVLMGFLDTFGMLATGQTCSSIRSLLLGCRVSVEIKKKHWTKDNETAVAEEAKQGGPNNPDPWIRNIALLNSTFHNITALDISSCNVSDDALSILLSGPNVKSIEKIRFQNVRLIHSCGLSSDPLDFCNLQEIGMAKCNPAVGGSVIRLARHSQATLRSLMLEGLEIEPLASFPNLCAYSSLSALALTNCQLPSVAGLAELPSLTALFLGGSSVPDDHMQEVINCRRLKVCEMTFFKAEALQGMRVARPDLFLIDFMDITEELRLRVNQLLLDPRMAQLRPVIAHAANCIDMANRTPLHHVVITSKGDLVKLEFLLELKCEVDLKDIKGCTPFIRAAELDQADVVEMLFRYGADPTSSGQNLETPLFVACLKGHFAVAERLFSLVPDVDIFRNPKLYHDNWTPTIAAVIRGSNEILRELIRHNFMLDVPNKNGYTPLHVAVRRGDVEAARALLEAGVNLRAGQPALENVISRTNKLLMAELLRLYGTNSREAQRTARARVHSESDDNNMSSLLGGRQSTRPEEYRRTQEASGRGRKPRTMSGNTSEQKTQHVVIHAERGGEPSGPPSASNPSAGPSRGRNRPRPNRSERSSANWRAGGDWEQL